LELVMTELRNLTVMLVLMLVQPTLAMATGGDYGDSDVTMLVSPRVTVAGNHVRVLAASDTSPIADLAVADPEGRPVAAAVERRGGPPWSAVVAFAPAEPGLHRVEATRDGRVVGCHTIAVAPADRRLGAPPANRARAGWDRESEALYAAWIEHLFDAPPEQSLGFDTLQEVLRDPARNLLYDHLGFGEDDDARGLGAPPDCADLPYVLRAYFGWKTGLPVGFRPCNRGSAARPPTCGAVETTAPAGAADTGWYQHVAHRVMDVAHSGSARTALDDDATDFYPVALTRAALRPGTIYADPYGHTLMIVQWVAQTPERSGMLLAVDAQPDNSVARKRFWEGTFLFADDVPSAGPGFKAFRPLVADGRGGVAPRSNTALEDDPRFAPYAAEQATLSRDEFYARVGRLINPQGLRPVQAYAETLAALVEQLETRVDSVQRGEEYVQAHPRATIPMPDGPRIFETIGPWEDFATPSRDLRLLIAMRVLLDLPERLVRHPDLFVLDGVAPAEARAIVEQQHARAIHERAITYVRSDGSSQELTVAELLARRPALEMAYNPNDCIEVRWGARPESDEHATCRRTAPREQRARMETHREWFREGRRPGR
jgi:hypothetical protein